MLHILKRTIDDVINDNFQEIIHSFFGDYEDEDGENYQDVYTYEFNDETIPDICSTLYFLMLNNKEVSKETLAGIFISGFLGVVDFESLDIDELNYNCEKILKELRIGGLLK